MYILLCSDGTYYTGVTSELERRVEKHQTGFYETCYTFTRRPVKLVYAEQYQWILHAIAREKQVKGWSHAKKQALIEGDFELLKQLSKKNKG